MSPLLAFSDTWDVLGPFQIGTRGNVHYFLVKMSLKIRQRLRGEQIHWNVLAVFALLSVTLAQNSRAPLRPMAWYRGHPVISTPHQ